VHFSGEKHVISQAHCPVYTWIRYLVWCSISLLARHYLFWEKCYSHVGVDVPVLDHYILSSWCIVFIFGHNNHWYTTFNSAKILFSILQNTNHQSCIADTVTGTAVHTAVILQVLVLILNYSYKMLPLLVLVLHYCLKMWYCYSITRLYFGFDINVISLLVKKRQDKH
jgi:hypothetical protein